MRKTLIAISAVAITLVFAGVSFAQTKTIKREYDGIIVSGDKLPPLLGASLEQIRVYAVKEGEFLPIPFQIDERNSEGKYSLTHGSALFLDENPAFDSNDEIVFMALDAGDKAANLKPPEGARAHAEVEITDPVDGSKAWVYIFGFKEAPAKSPLDYVSFSPSRYCFNTAYFEACNLRDSPWFENIAPKAPAGGQGKPLMDKTKFRSVTKLRSYLLGITFNIIESDFNAKLLGFKAGPVRVITRTQVEFTYIRGMTLNTDLSDNFFYYGYIYLPKSMKSPFALSSVATSMTIRLSADFNSRAKGNYYINSNMKKPVLIEGKMDDEKRAIDGGNYAIWNAVYGPKGNILVRGLEDPKAKVEKKQLFIDDAEYDDPPENEKGTYGSFGKYYEMVGLEKEHYWFNTIAITPKAPFKPKDAQFYLNIVDKPLETRARPYKPE